MSAISWPGWALVWFRACRRGFVFYQNGQLLRLKLLKMKVQTPK